MLPACTLTSCVLLPLEKGTHYYDAKEIPPEWHQWLTSKRDTPPSAESVRQAEAARNALREKAAALEDAQIGERLRVRSCSQAQHML
jgi:NADH:ubiquinone oxidoreductase subunit